MAKTSKTELIRELKPSFRIHSPFSRFWKLFSLQKKLTKTSLSSPPFTSFPNSTSDCHKNVKRKGGLEFNSRAVQSPATTFLLFHSISLFCLISSSPQEFSLHLTLLKVISFSGLGVFPTEKPIYVCPSIMTGKDYFPLYCTLFISPPQLISQ